MLPKSSAEQFELFVLVRFAIKCVKKKRKFEVANDIWFSCSSLARKWWLSSFGFFLFSSRYDSKHQLPLTEKQIYLTLSQNQVLSIHSNITGKVKIVVHLKWQNSANYLKKWNRFSNKKNKQFEQSLKTWSK